jgi:hypothetical protein
MRLRLSMNAALTNRWTTAHDRARAAGVTTGAPAVAGPTPAADASASGNDCSRRWFTGAFGGRTCRTL